MKINIGIEFIDSNFDDFLSDIFISPKVLEASLEIEEKIILYFQKPNNNPNFTHKFWNWLRSFRNSEFGQHMRCESILDHEDILNIDFSNSSWETFTSTNGEYDISIELSSVEIDFKNYGEKNKAFVELNNIGHRFIEQFYNKFRESFDDNESFENPYRPRVEKCYEYDQFKVYPKFHYSINQKRNDPVIKITKIPFFRFEFKSDLDYGNAKKIIDSYINVCSFYMHSKIDYRNNQINIGNVSRRCFKSIKDSIVSKSTSFKGFNVNWKVPDLLKNNWQKESFNNARLLKQVIELFIRSIEVGHRSTLLIRFNIIEMCMRGYSQEKSIYNWKKLKDEGAYKEKEDGLNESLEIMLKYLDKSEHEDFKKKWSGVSKALKYKTMTSDIESFFHSKNISLDELPIKFKRIKQVRDNITHGSISAKEKEVAEINILLYKLSGLLILDILQIKNTKLLV